MAQPDSARPETRPQMRSQARTLATRAFTGTALLAALAFGVASPAAAAPTPTESLTASPFEDVSLVPYFTGEPSWPSSVMPSFALRIDLETDYAIPGSHADLTLSDGIVAVTAPESITTSDQVPIADVEILDEGHTLRLTYTEAAAGLQDISGTMSVFANATDVTSAGGTITGEAHSGDTTFPLSLPYTAQAWDSMNIVSSWQPGATPTAPQMRTRSLVVGNPDAGPDGGQWIGVGGVTYWPGWVEPVTGTTRVFALDTLPEHLAGLTDPAAILTEGVDYTLNEQDQFSGSPVTGVSIPNPHAGIYVVEQLFTLDSSGAALFDAPNTALPEAGRAVYGVGTQVASGTVQSHATPGGPIQALSALAFFAGGGATANATASEPALSAVRTVAAEAEGSGSSETATRQVSVTVTNDGNTRLDASLDETIASATPIAVDAATATTGSTDTTGTSLAWQGTLEPGEHALISYTARVDRLPDSAAQVSITGTAVGVSPGGVSVDHLIADDQFTVAAAPDVPAKPDPEPGANPEPGAHPNPGETPDQGVRSGPDALPSTGSSAHTAVTMQSAAILAAVLGAVLLGAVLLGAGAMRAGHPGAGYPSASRRRHPVFTERSIRSTPVS